MYESKVIRSEKSYKWPFRKYLDLIFIGCMTKSFSIKLIEEIIIKKKDNMGFSYTSRHSYGIRVAICPFFEKFNFY